MSSQHNRAEIVEAYDAIVVGAGFAGMYMLLRLRKMGLSVRVYERGDGVGGTWYWNRYPGARLISRAWSTPTRSTTRSSRVELEEKYGTQPELLKYANMWPTGLTSAGILLRDPRTHAPMTGPQISGRSGRILA